MPEREPDEFVGRVAVLARVEVAELGPAFDADVVVDYRVWLLDEHRGGVWAAEAPEDEGARPEGAAVVDLVGQAVDIVSKVLELHACALQAWQTG